MVTRRRSVVVAPSLCPEPAVLDILSVTSKADDAVLAEIINNLDAEIRTQAD